MSVRTHSPTPILKYGRGTLLRFYRSLAIRTASSFFITPASNISAIVFPSIYSSITTRFFHPLYIPMILGICETGCSFNIVPQSSQIQCNICLCLHSWIDQHFAATFCRPNNRGQNFIALICCSNQSTSPNNNDKFHPPKHLHRFQSATAFQMHRMHLPLQFHCQLLLTFDIVIAIPKCHSLRFIYAIMF